MVGADSHNTDMVYHSGTKFCNLIAVSISTTDPHFITSFVIYSSEDSDLVSSGSGGRR